MSGSSTGLFVVLLMLSRIVCLSEPGPVVSNILTYQEADTLASGTPIERELSGGEVHSYELWLGSGQFLSITVDQRGIDVAVVVFDPAGRKQVEVDSPNGARGLERAFLVSEVSGSHRIEVRSVNKDAPPGKYEIHLGQPRTPTLLDHKRIEAERLFTEAERLRAQDTKESKQESIKKHEKALQLYRNLADRQREMQVLQALGSAYDLLGEKKLALDHFNQLLALQQEAKDTIGAASTLDNLGAIYFDLGEVQKALSLFEQALTDYRAAVDRRGEATTLNWIGAANWALGFKEEAVDRYTEALQILQAIGDRNNEISSHHNLGVTYLGMGEWQKAVESFSQALQLEEELQDRQGKSQTLPNLGQAYGQLGDWQKAIEYFHQGLVLSREIGDRLGEARTLHYLGQGYSAAGDQQQALNYYQQALMIRQEIGDRRGESATLQNIAFIQEGLGEKQKALELLDRALHLQREVGYRYGEAYTLTTMGKIYNDLGRREQSLETLDDALGIRQAVRDVAGEAATLYVRALVHIDGGNLRDALADAQTALDRIETMRDRIAGQAERAAFLASSRRFYELLVDVQMRLHRQQPSEGFAAAGLQTAERARARSLLELLAEARVNIRQGGDPVLLKRERSLQIEINAAANKQQQLLGSQNDPEQATAIAKQIESLTTRYHEIEAQIRKSSPQYAALTKPQPLTAAEIQQQLLDPDTLLLEYSLGDERSHLWAVTSDSINYYELPKRAELEKQARRVYALLTERNRRLKGETGGQRRSRIMQADREYEKASSALSHMLLGLITERLNKKRLLIVADGALQYVSFGALPTPVADGSRLPKHRKDRAVVKKPRPLILDHEIVILPSASTLSVLRRELGNREPGPGIVAVLADPVFSSDDARIKSTATGQRTDDKNTAARDPRQPTRDVEKAIRDLNDDNLAQRLLRLDGTRWEAERIRSLVPRQSDRLVALDFAANRDTATSSALGKYRIVHFATHALINSVHPELSGIVLSLVDEKGNSRDGFLRAHEIYNLKLPAELVVLSGCRTGLGKEVRGEGLIGLTRGFMYAGAARVMVSLWSVDDRATAELMGRFYRNLLKGRLPAAAALQSAQVEMWQERRWRSPYFWAGFVLQGEWR